MTHPCRLLLRFLLACTLASALPAALPVFAADGDSKVLVARPGLRDNLYGSTILLAKPMSDGSSVGFIMNKPTPLTLGQLFPDHAASLKVPDPVFLGGPVGTNVVFALVERPDSPGGNAVQVAPGVFLAIEAATVDRIIETESDHARFLVGMVVWRPGELNEEMKRGLWYEMKPDSHLLLNKKTEGMWEELVSRSQMLRDAI